MILPDFSELLLEDVKTCFPGTMVKAARTVFYWSEAVLNA